MMTGISKKDEAGYSIEIDVHLSNEEARRITHDKFKAELVEFVSALDMTNPVSTDKAATLLEHIIKEQMSADSKLIADQMHLDQWEDALSNGEHLGVLAKRACSFFATDEGIELHNFFVKTLAKTTKSIY
jgi:hypothetical protein